MCVFTNVCIKQTILFKIFSFKSAFTLTVSTRCARIADIPFTANIILL